MIFVQDKSFFRRSWVLCLDEAGGVLHVSLKFGNRTDKNLDLSIEQLVHGILHQR